MCILHIINGGVITDYNKIYSHEITVYKWWAEVKWK